MMKSNKRKITSKPDTVTVLTRFSGELKEAKPKYAKLIACAPEVTEIDALIDQDVARISDDATNEANNKTNTTRKIANYEEVLGHKFTATINWHYQNYGLINILDSGCGNAVFSRELLESDANRKIKRIYGVSMDKFSGAVTLDRSHPKFTLIHESIDKAIQRIHDLNVRINIIFDVWGPFSYSLYKMDLLRDYYSVLKKGGRAFLFLGTCFSLDGEITAMPKISFKNDDDTLTEPENILKGLNKRYPKHFNLIEDERVLVVCKSEDEFPIPYDFEHSCSPFLGFSFIAKGLSKNDMLRGNAAMPAEITIKPRLKQKLS